MKRKFPPFPDHTLKGFIFGFAFFMLFVLSPLTIILKYFLFPELSLDIIIFFISFLASMLVGVSFKISKWYWDWADRVMARFFGLFRSNGSK